MHLYLPHYSIFGWLNKKKQRGLCIFTPFKWLKKLFKYVKIYYEEVSAFHRRAFFDYAY